MPPNNQLIIGISGVTCGGKTTLATKLNKLLPGSYIISQDSYFWDVSSPRHTWIAELNHINFDIVSSLDMERMHADILEVIENGEDRNPMNNTSDIINCASLNDLEKLACKRIEQMDIKVLIIEGFCIFNYKPIAELCNLKYYFTLTKNECYQRRIKRVYEPPDCVGYFEKCVWPEYLNLYNEVKENVNNIIFFDGALNDAPLERILTDVCASI